MILPLLSAIAFFTGILLASFSDVNISKWTAIFALVFLIRKPWFACLLLAFLFGFFRMQFYEKAMEYNIETGWVELTGKIIAEVDQRKDEQKLTLGTEDGNRILVSASQYAEIHYGDSVKVSGFLNKLEPGSYARYLFRYKILYQMDAASLNILEEASPSFLGLLYDFKSKLMQRINAIYFEPEASLVAGLLLGSRKGMSEELTADFQATGLTHIVAVSGYNISLVIACIFSVFAFFSMKKRVIVSLIAVCIFVLFVGASAAAVRAGIMGSLAMWALYSGRHSQVFFVLLWSAVCMVLFNPAILAFDIGFQLSFVATLGLLVFAPMLKAKIPIRDGFFKEALMLTLSAQISTAPFIIFYFGRFSLISPLANILITPFIPLAMLFSALSLIGEFPFGILASVFLKIIIVLTQLLAQIPFADVPLIIGVESFLLSLFLLTFFSLLFYKSKLMRAFGLEGLAVFSKVQDHESQKHEIQSKRQVSIEE